MRNYPRSPVTLRPSLSAGLLLAALFGLVTARRRSGATDIPLELQEVKELPRLDLQLSGGAARWPGLNDFFRAFQPFCIRWGKRGGSATGVGEELGDTAV